MLLQQTVASNLPPLALELEPQLLLTLLVALLFLILVVIGVFAVWSRARHLQLGGQSLENHEWRGYRVEGYRGQVGFREGVFWETDASDERKDLFAQTWDEFQKQRPEMTDEERRVAQLVAMAPKLLYEPSDTLSLMKVARELVNDRDVYLHYQLEILKDYDIAEESEPVVAPVFLALGRYDYIAPYTLWSDERRAALPNLSYHLFSKSGHFPQIEESELFDSKLIEWISRHPLDSGIASRLAERWRKGARSPVDKTPYG